MGDILRSQKVTLKVEEKTRTITNHVFLCVVWFRLCFEEDANEERDGTGEKKQLPLTRVHFGDSTWNQPLTRRGHHGSPNETACRVLSPLDLGFTVTNRG